MRSSNHEVSIVFEGLQLIVDLDIDDENGVYLNDIASETGDCVAGLFNEVGKSLIKYAAYESLCETEAARVAA